MCDFEKPNLLWWYFLIESSSSLRYEDDVRDFARTQIIFIRLTRLKLEDWFSSLESSRLDPRSPLYEFFKDKEVWDLNDGDLRLSFTAGDYF